MESCCLCPAAACHHVFPLLLCYKISLIHPVRSLLDPASRDVKNLIQYFPLIFARIHLYLPLIYHFARQAVRWEPFILTESSKIFSRHSHVIAKHIEGRANNFKKPINISWSPSISQWDILTNMWAAWILCVTCWRNRSHDPAPWNGYNKFRASFYMLSIHYCTTPYHLSRLTNYAHKEAICCNDS